jgi:hypothetical protein
MVLQRLSIGGGGFTQFRNMDAFEVEQQYQAFAQSWEELSESSNESRSARGRNPNGRNGLPKCGSCRLQKMAVHIAFI